MIRCTKADLWRIVENEEIRTIINVVGTGTRDTFDIGRLKFNRIIIATDADVDGLHIQCLLLTLFYQEFSDLIEQGHVYIACRSTPSNIRERLSGCWMTRRVFNL